MSDQDIRRGDRGMDVIAGELQDRDYGIVVLTRENLKSEWVHFEAGALGKSLGTSKVAPLLLDVTRADVVGPLAQFQSTLLTDRDDFRQFIRDLAAHAPNVPSESVEALFDSKWAELEAVVTVAAGMGSPQTTRSAESMLEELLEIVRRLERVDGPRFVRADGAAARNEISKAIITNLLRKDPSAGVSFNYAVDPHGMITVSVDTKSDATFDAEALQNIADTWEATIVLERQGVSFTPRTRFRDASGFFRALGSHWGDASGPGLSA